MVPQTHVPGAEAEVDFGDVTVELAGKLVVCSLFSLRMSFSGRAVHQVFTSGGRRRSWKGTSMPSACSPGYRPARSATRTSSQLSRVCLAFFARVRAGTERWTLVRSHYGLDAFYCQPGIEGAHEKVGLDGGQVGWYRRNHFVPRPEGRLAGGAQRDG